MKLDESVAFSSTNILYKGRLIENAPRSDGLVQLLHYFKYSSNTDSVVVRCTYKKYFL